MGITAHSPSVSSSIRLQEGKATGRKSAKKRAKGKDKQNMGPKIKQARCMWRHQTCSQFAASSTHCYIPSPMQARSAYIYFSADKRPQLKGGTLDAFLFSFNVTVSPFIGPLHTMRSEVWQMQAHTRTCPSQR